MRSWVALKPPPQQQPAVPLAALRLLPLPCASASLAWSAGRQQAQQAQQARQVLGESEKMRLRPRLVMRRGAARPNELWAPPRSHYSSIGHWADERRVALWEVVDGEVIPPLVQNHPERAAAA